MLLRVILHVRELPRVFIREETEIYAQRINLLVMWKEVTSDEGQSKRIEQSQSKILYGFRERRDKKEKQYFSLHKENKDLDYGKNTSEACVYCSTIVS